MSVTTEPTPATVPLPAATPTKAAATSTSMEDPEKTTENHTETKQEDEQNQDRYQPPSKCIDANTLHELHQHGIWFPEEIDTTKFTFADKTASFGPHKLANINNNTIPWRNQKGERIDTNIKFPKMYVLSLKWLLSQTTGTPGSTKLILGFDNRGEAFKQPGSDENNFYQYLEKMDDAMRSAVFEKRKAWGLSYSNATKAKDAYNDGQPLVSYGRVIGDTPENSNPWLDESGNIVEDYENYQGKMTRKYGPKFYAVVGIPYTMEDVLQSDGTYKKVKREKDAYNCEFIDGNTGEAIDLRPSNIQAWFQQEKTGGLQAEGYYSQRFVQLVTGKAPFIRNEVRQICLYPPSSRPAVESAPLPRGLGIAQAKVAPKEEEEETEATKEVKDEKSPPVPQIAEIPEEEVAASTPPIVSSHDKYLESMKREAAEQEVETEHKDDTATEDTESAKVTPAKKKKQRTH